MAKIRTLGNGAMEGRVAGLAYVPTRQGTSVRALPRRRARTPGEKAQAARVARIGAFWAELEPEGVARWRAYSEGLVAELPALERRPMGAYQAFLSLATRLLQMEPRRATIPLEPPAHRFVGDAVGVTAISPQGEGGGAPSTWEATPADSGRTTFASPPSADPPTVPPFVPQGEPSLEEGPSPGVLFVPNRPNAEGVVTELLVQPLRSAGRAPQAGRYASRGFVAFAAADEGAFVPLASPWAACAVRFVETATGQASGIVPCGIVRAG